ncbi:hypothetical protein WN50_14900 [Limnoraphis robusta CS-951]|uniref:Uncharacterized protein n=1 Tax=Limnoraphis robusta CS-951 TaxID=1637645 RepID=A0A0F5YFB7_9CYAN|nr:hypothetical protein WN50_14900 [Limnoraphis robusta CS-951]
MKASIQAKPLGRETLTQLIENHQSSNRFSEENLIKKSKLLRKPQRKKRLLIPVKSKIFLKRTKIKKL